MIQPTVTGGNGIEKKTFPLISTDNLALMCKCTCVVDGHIVLSLSDCRHLATVCGRCSIGGSATVCERQTTRRDRLPTDPQVATTNANSDLFAACRRRRCVISSLEAMQRLLLQLGCVVTLLTLGL